MYVDSPAGMDYDTRRGSFRFCRIYRLAILILDSRITGDADIRLCPLHDDFIAVYDNIQRGFRLAAPFIHFIVPYNLEILPNLMNGRIGFDEFTGPDGTPIRINLPKAASGTGASPASTTRGMFYSRAVLCVAYWASLYMGIGMHNRRIFSVCSVSTNRSL